MQIGRAMRISPTFSELDTSPDPRRTSIDKVIRALLGLTGKADGEPERDSGAGNGAEEVLVDAEVDGERYLLVRMPRASRERIQLSPREHEIVRMVARGHPNKVIADVLNISSWTVCTHMRRIFAKLGVGSRAAMVAQLHSLGPASESGRATDSVRQDRTRSL
jgi:DNA-binding CsgD family transcriptional regulator